MSRRLPPEGGERGEAAWRVVQRLAGMHGAEVVWVAPSGKPWERRVVPGVDRAVGVDIRYVPAGPWPLLDPVGFLPGLVREGIALAPRADVALLPRGDWLLEAALLAIAPSCPVCRWDPNDPDGPWPLIGAAQGA